VRELLFSYLIQSTYKLDEQQALMVIYKFFFETNKHRSTYTFYLDSVQTDVGIMQLSNDTIDDQQHVDVYVFVKVCNISSESSASFNQYEMAIEGYQKEGKKLQLKCKRFEKLFVNLFEETLPTVMDFLSDAIP